MYSYGIVSVTLLLCIWGSNSFTILSGVQHRTSGLPTSSPFALSATRRNTGGNNRKKTFGKGKNTASKSGGGGGGLFGRKQAAAKKTKAKPKAKRTFGKPKAKVGKGRAKVGKGKAVDTSDGGEGGLPLPIIGAVGAALIGGAVFLGLNSDILPIPSSDAPKVEKVVKVEKPAPAPAPAPVPVPEPAPAPKPVVEKKKETPKAPVAAPKKEKEVAEDGSRKFNLAGIATSVGAAGVIGGFVARKDKEDDSAEETPVESDEVDDMVSLIMDPEDDDEPPAASEEKDEDPKKEE